MKYNSYSVTITDDYLTNDYSEEKHVMEWASEYDKTFKPDYKQKNGFKTFAEAYKYVVSLNTSDTVTIEDKCCGEVFQSTNVINKCKCCGHTSYDTLQSDEHHTDQQHDWQLIEKV